jgi:hypothetical protein
MPTDDVSFTMPDGGSQPSLEWLASATETYTPIHDKRDQTNGTCMTTYMFDPSATTFIAPEPSPPADCLDGGMEDVALGDDAGANADAAAQCDPRYASDNIVPGLTKPSDSGALTFILVNADHVPPVANYNSWVIKVLDKNGQPVTDAAFTKVTTYMPLHGHSSSVTPIVTDNGDGTYTINKLDLFMPGVWWVTPYVQVGSTTDTVKFSFCAGS